MDALLQDVRYALRSLRKSPGFTTVAVLTLALGIGANTAIFSVVDAVLLKPVPYPDAGRLYAFVTTFPQGSFDRTSAAKFNSWRTYAKAFDHISGYRFTSATVITRDEPEQTPIGQVTADFFPLFGASTIEGRTFSAEEDRPNSGHVVVLSSGYWQHRLGADRRLIGGTLTINGLPHTVVGVLSPAFQMPEVVPAPDLWLPLQIDPASTEQAHLLWAAGRLKATSSVAEGVSQLQLAANDFRRRYPELLGPQGSFGVERYQDVMVRDVRTSLLVLSGAVGFVLLIACANVASLLLVRAVGRKREMAVRSAIGAGRVRLIRQLLTESLMLSLIGGALGLVLGIEGIRALLFLNPAPLPRIDPRAAAIPADWRILLFTVNAALITGIAFGLFPAVQVARTDLNTTLKESSGRSGTFRQNTSRRFLVVAQTALALVLLVGSALLIRSFAALRTINPGFASDHVLTMRMSLTGPRFSTTAGVAQFARQAEERLSREPGVVAVGTTCCVPLEGKYGHLAFEIVGRPSVGPAGGGGWVTASPGYFDVFKIPLVRGRLFTERDTSGAPPVVIISESLARRYWPMGDPLAEQLLIGKGMGPQFIEEPRQIVGIVGDVREALGVEAEPMMYVPTAQVTDGMTVLLNHRLPIAWAVRTVSDPFSLAAVVQENLRQASGGVKPSTIRSMDDLRRTSTARANFNMVLLTIFGGAALVLAAIGIYGLMAYSVQQRTHEMGIRLALGAESTQVRNMVVWQGMRVALLGVGIGIAAAFGLTRLLTTFLFGVTAHDPIAFVAVSVVICAVALIGVWLPARRAARVDPVTALRAE